MTAADASSGPLTPANPIARLTEALFGLVPMSLTMLVLRIALALPFCAPVRPTGTTGSSSPSASRRASPTVRLHLFGGEYPFPPIPRLMATGSARGETGLPVLLIFGLGARYAALGLLAMTAVIQLTFPDGWANFHLHWAALALAIMTFGPGRIALDRLFGLERARV